jgi:NhaP-type Na+/H+ or K+/H+ antiporter
MYKESELTELIVRTGEEALTYCMAKYFFIIIGASIGWWNQGHSVWWRVVLMVVSFFIAAFYWFGQVGADKHRNSLREKLRTGNFEVG